MNSETIEICSEKELGNLHVIKKPKAEELGWYVFYTYPRAEKVVYKDLIKRNYDVFLPLTKTLHLWKNRQKKLVELPLFPSYIFVKARNFELNTLSKLPKVVTCISCNGKPSVIPAKEIETIKKALMLEQEITVENKFYEGEKVRITDGPLAGNEGIVFKHLGKTRFGVLLSEIKHTIIIDVSRHHLVKC